MNRDKREELLQQMDIALAKQKDRIEGIQDKETKKDLENIAKAVEELHFKIQMDDGLKVLSANKRMNSFYSALANIFKGKYVKNILLAFIAGLMVALIPTLIYINSIKEDGLSFQFAPNAIAERKPIYLQMINTQEKLDAVQILENQDMVETAKKWKQLTYKEFLELGGAIDCPSTVPCYVISKSAVEDRLIVKPFKSSKPE